MRIYNPRIGRFLSVDPLTPEYPWYTPYQFAGNMPIEAIDLDGLEKKSTKEGFWEGVGKSALTGIKNILKHIANNPAHARYGGGKLANGKPPTIADIKKYEINWQQQLDPTWQIQNFSTNLVYGTGNFVGGIIDGNGRRTAQAVPALFSSWGLLLNRMPKMGVNTSWFASFKRLGGKQTLNIMSKTHVNNLLKDVKISTIDDIIKNPTWLHGKTPEEVLKALGESWKEVESVSKTGGGQYSNGHNYLRYIILEIPALGTLVKNGRLVATIFKVRYGLAVKVLVNLNKVTEQLI